MQGNHMKAFEKIVATTGNILIVIAALCLAGAIAIVSWMILWRWFGGTNHWELETSIYLIVAAVFLSSPYTLRTGGHIGMELLEATIHGSAEKWLGLIAGFVGLTMCLFLTWYGAEMTWTAFVMDERELGLFSPPVWPKYMTVPIGMSLTAAQYLCGISATIVSLKGSANV